MTMKADMNDETDMDTNMKIDFLDTNINSGIDTVHGRGPGLGHGHIHVPLHPVNVCVGVPVRVYCAVHCKPSLFGKQFCMANTAIFISYITFQSN
jgi:hypothetical protein